MHKSTKNIVPCLDLAPKWCGLIHHNPHLRRLRLLILLSRKLSLHAAIGFDVDDIA